MFTEEENNTISTRLNTLLYTPARGKIKNILSTGVYLAFKVPFYLV